MKKSINVLLFGIITFTLSLISVNASTGDFGLACSSPQIVSTEEREYSYTNCTLYITAYDETSEATLDFKAVYADLPIVFYDLTPAVDAELKSEEDSMGIYKASLSLKDGLKGRIAVADISIESSYANKKALEAILWTINYNSDNAKVTKQERIKFNIWTTLFADGGKYKDVYVDKEIERFDRLGEYIYSSYYFDNAIYYESNNTNHALLAFQGTIDLDMIPEGLELDSVNVDSSNHITAVELNKETGQFVIDFDVSEEALIYQSANPIKFTISYKRRDKLPEEFTIDIKDIKYVTNSSKSEEFSLENEKLSTTFKQAIDGDWNEDDEFNLVDLVAYRMYLAGNDMSDYYEGELTDNLKSIVDLNKDENINLLDLIAARKNLVGLPIE